MTPLQLRLARTALSLTVREAAELAQVSHETIVGIEAARASIKEKTIEKVRTAFEKAGIEFIDEDGGGPGVRLRKAKAKVRGKAK
jgi:transcriptional regulator with XRE-family HTH domain